MAEGRLIVPATIRFVATEEGGRRGPVSTGYRPQFYYDGTDYDCEIAFEGNGVVSPGEEAQARIRLSAYASSVLNGRLANGGGFCLREGARVVASGVITGEPVP